MRSIPFLVLMLLATSCASADEISKPLSPLDSMDTPTSQGMSRQVRPGPLESERTATLSQILKADGKGIGVRAYMAAFLDLESRVENGASTEDVRTRLDSLNAALNKQLSSLGSKARNTSKPSSDIGILGLKFKINLEKLPEVQTVFEDGPAATAQLKEGDIITQVNGTSTQGLGKEIIYGLLVGKPDTKINLTILRSDAAVKKTLIRMRAKDFAKLHPDIWQMYLSTM